MILLNIRNIVNEYVECNIFEIRVINEKAIIYYYDMVKHFSSNKIIVISKNKEYSILGKNMVIETMFKDQIIISGEINKIILGEKNE